MIKEFLKKPIPSFIFSLLCGLAYFGIACHFINMNTENGSMLLAFFFFPAIICGAALIILKAVRMYIEEDNDRKLNFLVVTHILLMIISAVMVIGI